MPYNTRRITKFKTQLTKFNQYMGDTVNMASKGNKAWMQSYYPVYVKRKSEGTLGRVRKPHKKK